MHGINTARYFDRVCRSDKRTRRPTQQRVRRDSARDAKSDVSRCSRPYICCTGAPRRSQPPSPSPPSPPSPPPTSNVNGFRCDVYGRRTGRFTATGTFVFNFGDVASGPQRTSKANSGYDESVRNYLSNPMNEPMGGGREA